MWWRVFRVYVCLKRGYPEIHWCIIILPNKRAIWEVYQHATLLHFISIARALRIVQALLSCLLVPLGCFLPISWEAITSVQSKTGTRVGNMCMVYTEHAQNIMICVYSFCKHMYIELNREAMFFSRRTSDILHSFPIFPLFRNRDAEVVHHRNVVLGFSTALLGSLQEPPACTSLADLGSLAFVVHLLIRRVELHGHQAKQHMTKACSLTSKPHGTSGILGVQLNGLSQVRIP